MFEGANGSSSPKSMGPTKEAGIGAGVDGGEYAGGAIAGGAIAGGARRAAGAGAAGPPRGLADMGAGVGGESGLGGG